MTATRHNHALVDSIHRVHGWQAERMPGERRRDYQMCIEVSVLRSHVRRGSLTVFEAATTLRRLGFSLKNAKRILTTNRRRGHTDKPRHWTPPA